MLFLFGLIYTYGGGIPKSSYLNQKKSQYLLNCTSTLTTYDNKINLEIAR